MTNQLKDNSRAEMEALYVDRQTVEGQGDRFNDFEKGWYFLAIIEFLSENANN